MTTVVRSNSGNVYTLNSDGSGDISSDCAEGQTTDSATALTLLKFLLAPDQTIDVTVTFVVRNTGASGGTKGHSYGFDQHIRWRRVGSATPTNWDTTVAPLNQGGDADESTISCTPVADGDNVSLDVNVNGVTGHTLNWRAAFSRIVCA
jgi:hypothetical protein